MLGGCQRRTQQLPLWRWGPSFGSVLAHRGTPGPLWLRWLEQVASGSTGRTCIAPCGLRSVLEAAKPALSSRGPCPARGRQGGRERLEATPAGWRCQTPDWGRTKRPAAVLTSSGTGSWVLTCSPPGSCLLLLGHAVAVAAGCLSLLGVGHRPEQCLQGCPPAPGQAPSRRPGTQEPAQERHRG